MQHVGGMLSPDGVSLEISNSGKFQLKSILGKIAILTGTVADGGTIPLPSGYAQADCFWMVGLGDGTTPTTPVGNSHPDGITFTVTADSNRLVTAKFLRINGGDAQASGSITANYIIVGIK